MKLKDIPVKKNSEPIEDTTYQVSADEFNCIVDAAKDHDDSIANINDTLDQLTGSSGVQYNMRITNDMDSLFVSASKGEACVLKITYVSQVRYSFKEDYQNTGENGTMQVFVKTSTGSTYELVKTYIVKSGVQQELDISEWITSGQNVVMLKCLGDVYEQQASSPIFTVTLTSLSINADTFAWWTPFSNDITFPLYIGGNVSKVLHVEVTGSRYAKSYEMPLGMNIYTDTAYNYVVPRPTSEGIYEISAYITNTDKTITTKTIAYNVMVVNAGSKVKLMVVNNIIEKAENWKENMLLSYSMYDGGAANTNAVFSVIKDSKTVYKSDENAISTGIKCNFSYPMEIDTLDNSDFYILFRATDVNGRLTSDIKLSVGNASGYSACAGSVFLLNPKTRTNRQANAKKIVNEVDGSEVECTWNNFSFSTDAWTDDEDGNKVLRVMAGSSIDIDYKPFSVECKTIGKTIEIDYKVSNVTDFTDDVLSICNSTTVNNYLGLRIFPDNVLMHSTYMQNDDFQNIYTDTDERIRLTLTVIPKIYGTNNNLVMMYVNGKKNREFTYSTGDYFAHDGHIIVGSDKADVDIYGIRIYNSGLTSQAVLQNYINWQVDNEKKALIKQQNDVLDANGSEVDFDNTVDQYNVMVFEPENGYEIPSLKNPSKVPGTLFVYFKDHPERNIKITNVLCEGQGTSSKKYWVWNLRYSLDKITDAAGTKIKSVVTYADGTTGSKTWAMTPSIPGAAKITAKKNFASSMQDHKAGSVNSINDLFKAIGLSNPAMDIDSKVRISVYQEPMVGFSKSYDDEGNPFYVFIGEYTIGPDKGDKYTFGYDTDKFPNLLSIEGSDNSPLCSLFRIPWNGIYNADEEAFQSYGANAWDFDGGIEDNIKYWIPAYNFVYSCSNRLKPWAGTLEELNANYKTASSEACEYWIASSGANQYNVYYDDTTLGKFVPGDIGGGPINLVTQLVGKGYGIASLSAISSLTNDQKNDSFISARVTKFKLEAANYFNIDDALFHTCWTELFAGTDNRAKNTYPYYFNASGKWQWRYDDVDTILSTNNQGLMSKPYYVEVHDFYSTGGPVWNGETSNFWNLIDAAFEEERVSFMRRMMTAMETLGGVKSGTDYDKLLGFYKKYYVNDIKEYFPQNVINADAKYTYETSKFVYGGLYTNDTDPITQSYGDAYSPEMAWMKKRIVYMMSKYSFGMFSANGTDIITVRAAGDKINYQLTPAVACYPAIANGTSIVKGERTMAGETCNITINLGGSADQQNNIQGANYIQSIGEWYDKNVSGAMSITGKMLREVRLGHTTANITISITSLSIGNCTSLQLLDLTRIASLNSALDLSSCTHLKQLLCKGTNIPSIQLPDGSRIEKLVYSDANRAIILQNLPLLDSDNVELGASAEKVIDYLVEDCPNINPLDLLLVILNSQASQASHALKNIRAVGFDNTYSGAAGTDMLDKLAILADGTYHGLNKDGVSGEDEVPVLDGTLTINANCYEDSTNALKAYFNKLALNITGAYYIRFKDPEVQRICAESWGDGVGITKEQAAAVQSLGDKFRGNSEITEFDEFQFFTGFPERGDGLVLFGDTVDNGSNCFRGMANLRHFIIPRGMTNLSPYAVYDCPLLEWFELPSTLTSVDWGNTITIGSLPNLQYIICKAVAPINRGNLPVGNSTWKLLVPYGSVEAYRNDERWSSMASRIQPILVHELASITATYNDATGRVEVTYDPVHTAYRDVTYTVISGAQYATIDSNGKVRPLEGADNSPVTIEVSSVHDPSVKSSVDIQVTYTGVVLYDCMTTDGASYIKTGIIPANDMRVEAKAYITATNNALFGSRAATSSKAFGVQFIDSSKIRAEVGTAQKEAVSYSQDTDYEMSLTPSEFVVNGVSYATGVSTIGGAAYEMYLGSLNTAGLAHTGQWNGGIYYFRVYKSDVLVMDLRPAEVGGIICFHDMVSGDNYYNAGTGKMSVR